MPIETTEQWRNEITKQFRYPGRVRMTMEVASNVDKSSVEASAQPINSLTNVGVTLDGDMGDYEPIATFEGIWRADGTMYLPSSDPSENAPLPLMSASTISLNNRFMLSYTFPQPTSFVGLSFVWDTVNNAWPTDVTILGYDINLSETYNYHITTIDSATSALDTPMDNVTEIRVVISEWSKPELRLRMSEIIFGILLQFTERQIMHIREETQHYGMGEKLPVDTQRYQIRNQIYREQVALISGAEINKSHPLTDVSRIFNATAELRGIASVETQYWKADGTLFLPSRVVAENPNIPWMSETDDFSASDPIELIVTYDTPVQINTINLTWDAVTNSWPTDATVEGKDTYGNVVFSRNITATGVYTKLTNIIATVKTIHVTIRQWSRSGWRARIGQFEAFLCYGNNNIPSEVNNLFDPTLTHGYSKYLARRQKVTVQYGLDTPTQQTLWLPKQTRFLDSWEIPTDAISVDFTSTTRLGMLTNDYRFGLYKDSEVTFKQLALDVLQNSNVITDISNPEPWELSDILDQYTTNAPLPVRASNALLQLIAGATGCTLDTNPLNGYIRISDAQQSVPYVLNAPVQQQSPSVTLETPLRSISIRLYNYKVQTDSIELFNGTVKVSGTQRVVVAYENDICAVSVSARITGASLSSYEIYSYAVVFYLTVAQDNTSVHIELHGKPVATSNTTIPIFLDDTVDSGRDIIISNPLITNMETLNRVAECALAYYQQRTLVSFEYLGFPDLKAGDKCALYSQYLNGTGVITDHRLTFNGGFNGKINMKVEG